MSSMADVFKAQFAATIYWYKNNKWLLVSVFIWPYLMVIVLLGIGLLLGDIGLFSKRIGVEDPAFYLFSASAVAMSSVGIVDAVAGFALYNRWLGTLPYIFMTPIRESKLVIAAGLPESILVSLFSAISVLPAALYFEGLVGGIKLFLILCLMYMGMIPLVGLSVIAAAALLYVREESNIINSIVPFILLLSGVFYPVKVLPSVLQKLSIMVPTRYVVDSAKMAARLASPPWSMILYAMAVLALLGFLYNGLASISISHAEKAVRIRGVD